jgi:hypothetical protein
VAVSGERKRGRKSLAHARGFPFCSLSGNRREGGGDPIRSREMGGSGQTIAAVSAPPHRVTGSHRPVIPPLNRGLQPARKSGMIRDKTETARTEETTYPVAPMSPRHWPSD